MSSRWVPQSQQQRRRDNMSKHGFFPLPLPSVIWSRSVTPDHLVTSRVRDRERHFFSDLPIREQRRPPDSRPSRGRDRERHYFSDATNGEPRQPHINRRPSMGGGHPRYSIPSDHQQFPRGYPYYEWDEFYDSTSPTGLHHESRPRFMGDSRDGEKTDQIPTAKFDSACTKLFQQLEKAEQFYQNFQNEFDGEVISIKKYAGDSILRELWSRRIGVPSSRRDSMKSEDEVKEWEDQLRKPCQRFRIQATKLNISLQKAATATITTPRSTRDETSIDSAKLLQDKIETAREGIRCLMDKVYRSREYCSELVKEIGHLKTLVNPQNSKEYEEPVNAFNGAGDGEYGPTNDNQY